jgi:triosephosphate isomerase
MIADAGGTHVLVGHSERRHVIGESDDVVAHKLTAALEAGLVPVLCVGEQIESRESGDHESAVGAQIDAALAGRSAGEVARVVIAYEPVWAIGTGKTATPQDAVAMHAFIRSRVRDAFGDAVAAGLLIQYGGSVKPDNAVSLLGRDEIDGALVGGASLEVESFLAIAGAAGAVVDSGSG